LQKDYPFQTTSLEVKTKTPSNVTFKVAGNRNAHGAIVGDIESKLFNKQHGLTLTNTWNTVNVLKTQIELDNQITQGLKLDLTTSIAPNKGSKSAVLAAVYKQSGFHSRANLDVLKVGPVLCFLEVYPVLLLCAHAGPDLHR
jgi:voltage-dependent anion channel protein 2